MKPYSKIKKRLAKKKIGLAWKIICSALEKDLKSGDVITTCKAYNEVIKEVEYVSWWRGKGTIICDIDIVTTGGNYCSLRHCCLFPPLSHDEILSDWKCMSKIDDLNKSPDKWDFGEQHNRLLKAVKNGEDPFDQNGCVKPEYVVKPIPHQPVTDQC